jgi:hypothetical protein
VDWMYLAEDRDRCRALVNTVMNVLGSSRLAPHLAATQEGLSSVGLVIADSVFGSCIPMHVGITSHWPERNIYIE